MLASCIMLSKAYVYQHICMLKGTHPLHDIAAARIALARILNARRARALAALAGAPRSSR